MAEQRDDRNRRAAPEVSTAPIRWDRVGSIARRKRRLILAAAVVTGVAVTAAAIVIAFAGKSAIDPSFSPPILSHPSATLDVKDPRMGWTLVAKEGDPGYVAKAALDAAGVKGDVLIPHWSIRAVGAGKRATPETKSAIDASSIPLNARVQHFALRQWIPTPIQMGRYVSELRLTTSDGRVVVDSRSEPFFVIGRDCCRRYETPAYVAKLPRAWSLEEDYEPNPVGRHVTLANGPYGNSVLIDTSVKDPEKVGKTALSSQVELERGLADSYPGYSRLALRVFRADDGEPVVEWSYRVEGDVFTNILFFRGPSGFAVRGRSGDSHFRETRDLTRYIARSLEAKALNG